MTNIKQDFAREFKKIPEKNRVKFSTDIIKLVLKAQEDDYENFNIE